MSGPLMRITLLPIHGLWLVPSLVCTHSSEGATPASCGDSRNPYCLSSVAPRWFSFKKLFLLDFLNLFCVLYVYVEFGGESSLNLGSGLSIHHLGLELS